MPSEDGSFLVGTGQSDPLPLFRQVVGTGESTGLGRGRGGLESWTPHLLAVGDQSLRKAGSSKVLTCPFSSDTEQSHCSALE